MIELLKESRNIVENGWCKYASAKDINGDNVRIGDSRADSHCVLGAMFQAAENLNLTRDDVIECMQMFQRANRIESVTNWNDGLDTTKIDVMNAFDNTIFIASIHSLSDEPEPSLN